MPAPDSRPQSRSPPTFTGVTPGTQTARSTGLTDRESALALASRWEEEAREERRRRQAERAMSGDTVGPLRPGYFTVAEVAAILSISQKAVLATQQRAIRKSSCKMAR